MFLKILKALGGILTTLACFAFSVIFASCLVTGVKHAVYTQQIKDSKDYYAENFECMGNCYVDRSSSTQENETSNDCQVDMETLPTIVDECLSQYPENLRSYIASEWTIVFADAMPEYIAEHVLDVDSDAVSAVSISSIKTIFVYIQSEDALRYVLTHEFAHALAYEYGCIDYAEEFVALYEAHKDTYQETSPHAVSGYAVSSSSEFFAATMSAYVTDPMWLQEVAPDVAEYMEELFRYHPYGNNLEKMFVEMYGVSLLPIDD